MGKDNRIKAAIIGSGQVARVSHIPGYRQQEGVEIIAACDTNEASIQAFAGEFGIEHSYTDYKQMLKECRPDVVSVCVPNKFHRQIVEDALNLGAHVFCEKPPAVSKEEAQSMYETAVKADRILTYDFHFRHGLNVKTAKDKIGHGELGEIYRAKATWLRRRGIPGWGNFISKDMQGGGPLIDIGAHMLDLSLYLLDYPQIAYVCASMSDRIGKQYKNGLMGRWNPEKFTVEDGLFGYIQFENGTSLELDTAFALNMKDKDKRNVELFGTKSGISLFPLEQYGGEDAVPYNQEFPLLQEGDLHFTAIGNFIKACRQEEELLVTAEQGYYVQTLIDALYQSAREGQPVKL